MPSCSVIETPRWSALPSTHELLAGLKVAFDHHAEDRLLAISVRFAI